MAILTELKTMFIGLPWEQIGIIALAFLWEAIIAGIKKIKSNSTYGLVYDILLKIFDVTISKWIKDKKAKYILPCLMIFFLVSCQGVKSLKYRPDKLNAGASLDSEYNVNDFFVKVTGRSGGLVPCKDVDGMLGNCSVSYFNERGLSVFIPKRNYDYHLTLECGDVNKKLRKKFEFEFGNGQDYFVDIPKEEFLDKVSNLSFCKGTVTPFDRENVQMIFRINLNRIPSSYVSASEIYRTKYKKKSYISLGKNARTIWLCSKEKCDIKKEKTYIAINRKFLKKKYDSIAYETFAGRTKFAYIDELIMVDYDKLL